MQDTIFIHRLRVNASVGIFDWEREIQQELVISCNLYHSLSAAGESNAIDDTVSYAQVAEAYVSVVQSQHYDLIEFLAEQLVQYTFEHFPINEMELTIEKPGAVPSAESVGIRIRRTRSE